MKSEKNFEAGQEIWVIKRTNGKAVDIASVLFLAESKDCIIASAKVNGCGFRGTLRHHIRQTSSGTVTRLSVYPIEECFSTKKEAERALRSTPEMKPMRMLMFFGFLLLLIVFLFFWQTDRLTPQQEERSGDGLEKEFYGWTEDLGCRERL